MKMPKRGNTARGDKTKGKARDSAPPAWGLSPLVGGREPKPVQPTPPMPDYNKPRSGPAVVDLVDKEQLRREHQHRDRSEQDDSERGEILKALETFNRQKAAEIEAAKDAAAREADSAHAAKVADIERHHSAVAGEQSRLDYFANREAVERQQQEAGDRTPTPDRQQDNGGWDRDR